MSIILKNPIWYQFNDLSGTVGELPGGELIDLCEVIKTKERLQEPANTFILKVKQETKTEYIIILDSDYFQNHCNKNFKTLINMFDIRPTNPIKVTLLKNEETQDYSQELEARLAALSLQPPQGSTSSAGTSKEKEKQVQALSKNIWVRYNDLTFSFDQDTLKYMRIFNVNHLIKAIKFQLRTSIENVYEKGITIIRHGENKILSSKTHISRLYNTEENALHIIIEAPKNKESHFDNQRVDGECNDSTQMQVDLTQTNSKKKRKRPKKRRQKKDLNSTQNGSTQISSTQINYSTQIEKTNREMAEILKREIQAQKINDFKYLPDSSNNKMTEEEQHKKNKRRIEETLGLQDRKRVKENQE